MPRFSNVTRNGDNEDYQLATTLDYLEEIHYELSRIADALEQSNRIRSTNDKR